MSEVLLVTDRKNRQVILKVANVQQRAWAESNCKAIQNTVTWLTQLGNHPGIARLMPLERCDQSGRRFRWSSPCYVAQLASWPGAPDFLATEYLPGGTLSRFVGKKRLPIEFALWIAYHIAQTLAFLHGRQCVHRDLKPENILFRTSPAHAQGLEEALPVLIDFGVAASVNEPKMVSGSRLWMAPELQTAYERRVLPVSPTWDVYALGLICCYMLSGIRPRRKRYDYQDYLEYQARVFALLDEELAEPSAASAVNRALQALLQRTLAQKPEQRPTAAEFAAELATLLKAVSHYRPMATALVQQIEKMPAKPRQKRQWLLLAAGLLGLLVVLVLYLTLGRKQPLPLAALAEAEARGDDHVVTVDQNPNNNLSQEIVAVVTGPVTAGQQVTSLPMGTKPLAGGHIDGRVDALPSTTPTATPSVTVLPPPPTSAAVAAVTKPPTLVALPTWAPTPSPSPTASLSPTASPTPSSTATATRLPTVTPTATARPTARPTTPLPTVAPVGTIRLIAPEADIVAGQARVEFAWEIEGAPLAPDQCFELVFWDPAKRQDQRSPVGAGRAQARHVNFAALAEASDPLLRSLMRSSQGFQWGVRIVECAAPATILRAVEEERHYTYQG
ncbi:MAG: protein kinase [Caldilineaceae bacterium]